MRFFPVIQNPRFKGNILIKDNTKQSKSGKHNSSKNVTNARSNAGGVNRDCYHYTEADFDFIKWFLDFVDEVKYNYFLVSIFHQPKERSPKVENKIARNKSRNVKQFLQTYSMPMDDVEEEVEMYDEEKQKYEEAKQANLMKLVDRVEKDDFHKKNRTNIDRLLTFGWVCKKREREQKLEQLRKQAEHEKMLREFNEMKEIKNIPWLYVSSRIK